MHIFHFLFQRVYDHFHLLTFSLLSSVAVANNKGFVVANFFTKCIVLVHPTVLSDGVEARNISRVQSMRRSLRSSLRRRSSTAIAEERRKIVASFNLESGIEEKRPSSARSPLKDRRTQSVDGQIFLDSDSPVVQVAIPPEQRGVVCHLLFSETHISGNAKYVHVHVHDWIFYIKFFFRWWPSCKCHCIYNGFFTHSIHN